MRPARVCSRHCSASSWRVALRSETKCHITSDWMSGIRIGPMSSCCLSCESASSNSAETEIETNFRIACCERGTPGSELTATSAGRGGLRRVLGACAEHGSRKVRARRGTLVRTPTTRKAEEKGEDALRRRKAAARVSEAGVIPRLERLKCVRSTSRANAGRAINAI